VRTLPRALASFRKVVEERGARLRGLSFGELQRAADTPTEKLTVDSRAATISVIVESCDGDKLRVVVQGFMKARFLPGKHVALDGFYKHRDGTVSPMRDDEFYGYD
jgi:hypothetical protein